MINDYLINYLVENDGTTFNCYSIVHTLENIEEYLQTHFEGLKELYDDGENFKLIPDSARYFELLPIKLDKKGAELDG